MVEDEVPGFPDAPAYYSASISSFLATSSDTILGRLSRAHPRELDEEQRRAWLAEIGILQPALQGQVGAVFFEFDIPRLGSRVDVVVLIGSAVFPIEFKCGETRFHKSDINQAWDYGLDLKNFHKASHDALILPILVATEATWSDSAWKPAHPDGVRPPLCCQGSMLEVAIRLGLEQLRGTALSVQEWSRAPYHPTPTIIEAARALYANHSVAAISRHDAGATNLSVTSASVESIIERSRRQHEKGIVFVTGVPGAGKTLVGLNVATRKREAGETHAVFLSGNGPLVSVLQEALTRDELKRSGEGTRKGPIRQKVKAFIQNVHHFRDEGLRLSTPPSDHVVIFDEAQRAWDLRKTADFMKRRKGYANFGQSEPDFLLSYLDRHEEWAVVVCLVGGGQEIHDGEAGIAAWLEAARDKYPHWRMYISPQLTDSEYAAEDALARVPASQVELSQGLHLATSLRSFRSEKVSAFVKALLDLDESTGRALLSDVSRRYPLAITRDLTRAKQWIRDHARGSESFGLVASSEAQRLKPYAIDIRVAVDPVHWFLNDRGDTRSSYYLEDAATEFQIQGLELDWVCVGWCADLRRCEDGWCFHSFRGSRWQNVRDESRRRYALNTYRVLLTRARQGMVVFVPPGDSGDPTRDPRFYDRTYEYLAGLGIDRLDR